MNHRAYEMTSEEPLDLIGTRDIAAFNPVIDVGPNIHRQNLKPSRWEQFAEPRPDVARCSRHEDRAIGGGSLQRGVHSANQKLEWERIA